MFVGFSPSCSDGPIKCCCSWVSDLLFFLSRARLSPFWTDRINRREKVESKDGHYTSISSEHQCIEARVRKRAVEPARAAASWLDPESSWLHCASLSPHSPYKMRTRSRSYRVELWAPWPLSARCWEIWTNTVICADGLLPPSWMCQRRKNRWATSGLRAPQLCVLTTVLGKFQLAEPWLSVMRVHPLMGIVWVRWILSLLPSGWQEVIITTHYSIDQGLSGALWLQWSSMSCVTVTIAIVLAAVVVNGGTIAGSSCLSFQPGSSLQVQRAGPGGCCGRFRVTVAYAGLHEKEWKPLQLLGVQCMHR